MADGLKIAGRAKPKPLPALEVSYPPVTSGGLTLQDIRDFLDLAEVLLRTGTDLNAPEKLATLYAIRRVLHLRFDKNCNHSRCSQRLISTSEYRHERKR